MIDARLEKLISLTEAAEMFPGLKKGARMNPESLGRLARKGCRGVRLETVMAGGRRCTSVEAVQRFISRISEPPQITQSPQRSGPSNSRGALQLNHGITY